LRSTVHDFREILAFARIYAFDNISTDSTGKIGAAAGDQ
jgi:hypothetical protein